MSFSGLFYLNSMPLQEHDLLAAPSDLEFQQVPDAALPPVRATCGGPNVPSSSLAPPAIASDGSHLPSNSAPPDLATQQLSNSGTPDRI